MISNSEQIVQQVQQDFQAPVAYVTGADVRAQTAYTVELTLFRRLLALGAALLRLFFVTRAAVRPSEPVVAPDGTHLRYHDQRPAAYYSVFGKVRFGWQYFTAPGRAGVCPLDAELGLPARSYSDLLRKWMAYGTTDESYRESQTMIERILGLSLSVQAIEASVADAAGEVAAFYDQPAEFPAPASEATTLEVQTDGKGFPWCSHRPSLPGCAWARGTSGARPAGRITGITRGRTFFPCILRQLIRLKRRAGHRRCWRSVVQIRLHPLAQCIALFP